MVSAARNQSGRSTPGRNLSCADVKSSNFCQILHYFSSAGFTTHNVKRFHASISFLRGKIRQPLIDESKKRPVSERWESC